NVRGITRREVARDVVGHLIRNKWLMEDARAWRKYVAKVRRVAERDYWQESSLSDDVADVNATETRLIESIEREGWNERPTDLHATTIPTPRLDLAKAVFTVEEASQFLGVSVGTVYSWIHGRRIGTETADGRFLIQKSELQRISAAPKLADVIAT